jgi:hypothetical protein
VLVIIENDEKKVWEREREREMERERERERERGKTYERRLR